MADDFTGCDSFKCIYEEEEEEVLELGLVRFSRGFGRKRILISSGAEAFPSYREPDAPLKRQRSQKLSLGFVKSGLESLPQDVLVGNISAVISSEWPGIRILCFVDHDDLRQLFMVSNNIREASVIAKQWHFAYATPRNVPAFRNSLDLDSSREFADIEPPNAPMRLFRKREIRKNLPDVATVLFPEAEI